MKTYATFDFMASLEAIKSFILGRHVDENSNAKNQGAFHGKQNAPQKDEPVRTYIQPVIDVYGLIWREAKVMVDNLRNKVEAIVETLHERSKQINDELNIISQKIAQLESDLPNHRVDFPWVLFTVLMLLLVGILGAEVWYNAKVLQLLRMGPVATICLAIGITLGSVLAFKERSKLMKKATTRAMKVAIVIGWIVGFTVLFYLIGWYRNEYVSAVGSDGKEFSVLLYIAINWIMLIAADIVLHRLPNTETIKAVFAKRKVTGKIAKLRKKEQDLKAELETVRSSIAEFDRHLVNLPNDEHNIRELARISMSQSISDFFGENRRHRTDKECAVGVYDAGETTLSLE